VGEVQFAVAAPAFGMAVGSQSVCLDVVYFFVSGVLAPEGNVKDEAAHCPSAAFLSPLSHAVASLSSSVIWSHCCAASSERQLIESHTDTRAQVAPCFARRH